MPLIQYLQKFSLMKQITLFTCLLNNEQSEELKNYLKESGFEFKEIPYTKFSAFRKDLSVTLYSSGKLVVQGKKTGEFVEFVLEPLILKKAVIGYEEVYDPSVILPRIGVDESGKGDYFGPLCVAGVYVNKDIIRLWKEYNIRDSKLIQSDNTIVKLADIIKKTPGCWYSIVPIGNEAYNRLYENMGSVHKILAWGHARVIENLMSNQDKMIPSPEKVVCDQFANSKGVINDALMKFGRTIEIEQKHKAESDIAVAAASILARCEFITRLSRLSKQYGIELPRGASGKVEEVALELVRKYGAEVLNKVAKLHFKTTEKIMKQNKLSGDINSKSGS